MGLCLDTSKWADGLWSNHLAHSYEARKILASGRMKQRQFPQFADDIHTLLYLKHRPTGKRKPVPPSWATDLLTQATDLAEFSSLRTRCQRNGFAAGVGTEALLSALVPLLQDQPPQPAGGSQGDPDGDRRRALRQGMREATRAVDAAEAALDGMADAFGLHAGTSAAHSESLQELDRIRAMYQLLTKNTLLQRIAALAGRLHRLGASHKRSKVTPATGSIKSVTLGGDLDRVLPAELVGLRSANRLHRLQTLGKLLDRRALQYLTEGTESVARGPIIVCLDKSGSMDGERDVWSSAVALTLLQTAMTQKRAWYMLLFHTNIFREVHTEPGHADIAAVCTALAQGCGGGTNFEPPLKRSLDILRTVPTMHKADIIFVTDGEGHNTQETIDGLNAAKAQEGVCIYAIGIGTSAKLYTLQAFATECYHLSARPEQDSAQIAPLLARVS